MKKMKKDLENFSLIWLGSCARAIPIVCKNLKNSLELVTNVNDSTNSPSPDRLNIFIYLSFMIDFILEKFEEFLNQNEHLIRLILHNSLLI